MLAAAISKSTNQEAVVDLYTCSLPVTANSWPPPSLANPRVGHLSSIRTARQLLGHSPVILPIRALPGSANLRRNVAAAPAGPWAAMPYGRRRTLSTGRPHS